MSAFPLPGFIVRRAPRDLDLRLRAAELAAHRWLVAHSITILRLTFGAIFLGFGLLKFFPNTSPAQDLVEHTTNILLLGLIPGSIALVLVAIVETVIGLCLLTGRAMRPLIYLLGVQLIGILSPLVLLPARLFGGPHGAPTLEGQYVLKDILFVGAALVLAATVGGARLTSERDDNHTAMCQKSAQRCHAPRLREDAVTSRNDNTSTDGRAVSQLRKPCSAQDGSTIQGELRCSI
jgi:putative oxidoreductase